MRATILGQTDIEREKDGHFGKISDIRAERLRDFFRDVPVQISFFYIVLASNQTAFRFF